VAAISAAAAGSDCHADYCNNLLDQISLRQLSRYLEDQQAISFHGLIWIFAAKVPEFAETPVWRELAGGHIA
jgi:hypothetical protein